MHESLTGLRICDTLVVLRELVSEKTWRVIACACRVKKSFKKKSTLHSPKKRKFDKLLVLAGQEDTLIARGTILRL